MKFTTDEIKLIGRLRKLDNWWPWRRWANVVAGVIALVAGALDAIRLFSLLQGVDSANWAPHMTVEMAALIPACLVFLGVGVSLVVSTAVNWHGNPNRTLLLKLLDYHVHEEESRDD